MTPKLYAFALLILAASFHTVDAWTPQPGRLQRQLSPSLRLAHPNELSDQELRSDIDKMKKQALDRLDALEHQMDELQEKQQQAIEEAKKIPTASKSTETEGTSFFEEPEEIKIEPTEELEAWRQKTSLHLLDDTRWKVAFNIGREAGTWMPADWAQSGDRLRFQAILDFSATHSSDRDEFFNGGTSYVCEVVEAFCYPEGVGKASIGRRSINVDTDGVFQIARGQGPAGTDLLRFALMLNEDVHHECESDVFVPAGRVYGTCGYFSAESHSHAVKEGLANEHMQLTRHLDDINRQIESEGNLFTQVGLLKSRWDVCDKLEKLSHEVNLARTQDPERSRLRLSRNGDVGLSKDGGVCCKVSKGMSIEYRILGKMEMGSIERRIEVAEVDNGASNDTSSKLHP